VVTHPGFEKTVAGEIKKILANSTSFVQDSLHTSFGGVEFQGRLEDMWRINAVARTPSRVSMRIAQFKATQFPELIRKIAEIPWELYISPHAQGQIQVTSRLSRLIHTDAIEERVAAGMAMHLGSWQAIIPQEALPHTLPQTILVRFESDICTLSIDSSGELLFKRGYDKFTEEAPLRDTLASCVLQLAGWDDCEQLFDPMCGSGTFSLEALLSRKPSRWPGSIRRFAFEEWPYFRLPAYRHMLQNLKPAVPFLPMAVIAGDKDSKAIETVNRNLLELNLPELPIKVSQQDFFKAVPSELPADFKLRNRTLIIMNPPYGIRISQEFPQLFQSIGDQLRKHYTGCRYAIMCPTPQDAQSLGLKWARQAITKNGGLEVMIVCGMIP
jgi:putative N6-adenine-specific DNA methylase